ncbi:mucoidy inhibitor MuiA family protein [Balneolaceae bacterium YR4-1]|uniref:Mucoidy inhibitor MuiA family protein n=1 Tax=Halalkalibaculum roseum TaxID=2709311 RepID=A0A6M1SUV3_9BACT|nr:DUF4139 domain-containing protein [Halalkalibaculum roseum]NGP76720.1 mucoidy inhibitor MuiA family protein [Halalkalibaculum roseum]
MSLLTIVLSLFLNLNAFHQLPQPSNATTVPSSIERATVYLQGAQITRKATVQLNSGSNSIIFNNLSNMLNEQSIQISSDVPVTLLSVRKSEAGNDYRSEKLDSLESEKKELESQIALKQAEQSVLDRELNILLSNQTLRGENEKISALEIKQAMEYFREKLTEIETSRIDVKKSLQEAQQQLNDINSSINELRRKLRQQSGQLIAEIESNGNRTVNFTISYFISSAGWYPSYDVRVENIDQPLELTYKANIYQNSGIDWNNVQLSVSSAQPLSSTNIPSIEPIYLRFLEAEARQRMEDASKMAPQALGEVVVTGYGSELSGRPAVSVNQNHTSFSFDIETPYTVSGDGDTRTVSVQNHSLPATYRYFAIPKNQETAYLTALLTDWEDLNLLNGEANLYFEKTFVGQAQIESNAVSDTLRFSLGKDEGIAIERNRLTEFSEKNFFGNRVRETRAWELVIRNSKNKAIELTLVDQIPVSTNEDIEIDLQERSGASLNEDTGELTWTLSIPAGSSVSRQFRYRVEYPTGKQIREK